MDVWTLDELAATGELIYPPDLVALVRAALAGTADLAARPAAGPVVGPVVGLYAGPVAGSGGEQRC